MLPEDGVQYQRRDIDDLSQDIGNSTSAGMLAELAELSELATLPQTLQGSPEAIMGSTYGRSPSMAYSGSSSLSDDPGHWYEDAHVRYIVGSEHAALFGSLRMNDKMRTWMTCTSTGFRQICKQGAPIILLAASTMLTWLQIHVIGHVAEKVMAAALSAAQAALGHESHISLTLEWMVLATSPERLRTSRINTDTMRHVWNTFSQTLGDQHCHTMVALYGFCFHLMLVEKGYAEAETRLHGLLAASRRALGPAHIFTVNVMATLSRSQRRQGKFALASETLDEALAAIGYGLNHPHRLELLLRKAILLWKLGHKTETERLYWIVARGRIATPGVHHEKTLAAHSSLIDVLKDNGTWEARKGDVQRLLVDPQMSVKDYERWWRDTSDSAREEGRSGSAVGDDSDE